MDITWILNIIILYNHINLIQAITKQNKRGCVQILIYGKTVHNNLLSVMFQAFIWVAIPNIISGSNMSPWIHVAGFSMLFQYLLRLYLIFPLSDQIVKATGVLMKTAWAGAAYNLMLFMLASHVIKLNSFFNLSCQIFNGDKMKIPPSCQGDKYFL